MKPEPNMQLELEMPVKLDSTAKRLWIKTRTGNPHGFVAITRFDNNGDGTWSRRGEPEKRIPHRNLELYVEAEDALVSKVPMFDRSTFDYETENNPDRIDWIPDDKDVFYSKAYNDPKRHYYEIDRYVRQPDGRWQQEIRKIRQETAMRNVMKPSGKPHTEIVVTKEEVSWKPWYLWEADKLDVQLESGFILTLREMKNNKEFNCE